MAPSGFVVHEGRYELDCEEMMWVESTGQLVGVIPNIPRLTHRARAVETEDRHMMVPSKRRQLKQMIPYCCRALETNREEP